MDQGGIKCYDEMNVISEQQSIRERENKSHKAVDSNNCDNVKKVSKVEKDKRSEPRGDQSGVCAAIARPR